jgi:hypothetical protein
VVFCTLSVICPTFTADDLLSISLLSVEIPNQYVFGGSGRRWAPLHAALRANDRQLHRRLIDLRTVAGSDDRVSALRVFDVLAWMEGRRAGLSDDEPEH